LVAAAADDDDEFCDALTSVDCEDDDERRAVNVDFGFDSRVTASLCRLTNAQSKQHTVVSYQE